MLTVFHILDFFKGSLKLVEGELLVFLSPLIVKKEKTVFLLSGGVFSIFVAHQSELHMFMIYKKILDKSH